MSWKTLKNLLARELIFEKKIEVNAYAIRVTLHRATVQAVVEGRPFTHVGESLAVHERHYVRDGVIPFVPPALGTEFFLSCSHPEGVEKNVVTDNTSGP